MTELPATVVTTDTDGLPAFHPVTLTAALEGMSGVEFAALLADAAATRGPTIIWQGRLATLPLTDAQRAPMGPRARGSVGTLTVVSKDLVAWVSDRRPDLLGILTAATCSLRLEHPTPRAVRLRELRIEVSVLDHLRMNPQVRMRITTATSDGDWVLRAPLQENFDTDLLVSMHAAHGDGFFRLLVAMGAADSGAHPDGEFRSGVHLDDLTARVHAAHDSLQ